MANLKYALTYSQEKEIFQMYLRYYIDESKCRLKTKIPDLVAKEASKKFNMDINRGNVVKLLECMKCVVSSKEIKRIRRLKTKV